MKVEELIRQSPIFINKYVSYEPLNGGLSNQTYKLQSEGKQYVLRYFGKQTDFLHLTRASEVEAMRVMSRIAGSPRVMYSDPSGEFVIMEFIEGRQVTGEDLLDSQMCRRIVDRMKQIHDSTESDLASARPCSPYHLVDSYLKGADQLQVKQPDGLKPLLDTMERISHSRSSDRKYANRFCHNDYYTYNLIWSSHNQELHVVDWELCGTGDIFFDLAAIPFTNRFTPLQEKQWLQWYFGYYEEEQYTILQDMKFMNMLRECSWGLLHSGLAQENANHGFDYYKHAEHVIERLQHGFNYF